MTHPQTLSLDGDDWTVYCLPPNEWHERKVWESEPPEAARRIPARVPGHVQGDLIRNGDLPDYRVGLNSKQFEWTSACDWVYEKTFTVPDELRGMRLVLRFEGIDDCGHVFLNGVSLGSHTGQFIPVEWDVSAVLRPGQDNRLLVVVEHAPNLQEPTGWTFGEAQSGSTFTEHRWKSRFAYTPDSGTRLVPVGLWDSVRLVATGPVWFQDVAIYTNVSIDRSEAALSIAVELGAMEAIAGTVVTEITQGSLPVASVEDPIRAFPGDTSLVQSVTVPRVQLWWPNGYGRQPLYEARISLLDAEERLLDRRVLSFGVRQVDAAVPEGAPEGSLPYALSVNGRKIWIKGWNWLPADQLYGETTLEQYERLLGMARDAHVNLLRVWGDGLLETETFYRLCDRYGIMVWQEFHLLPGSTYDTLPGDPAYVESIRDNAERILPRRRHHPSLVIWSGGSTLTNDDGQPPNADHPALAALRASVETDDPQRLWLPTSPSGPQYTADPGDAGELHDVFGPINWRGLREHPAFYNAIDPLIHSAFVCEGAANPETLAAVSERVSAPPDPQDPVWMHHGARWLRADAIAEAFGATQDLEQCVRASQALQAIGLQYAVEANRRRKWRCAGTLPWTLNEPWPTVAGTCSVDYYGRPKPAYYAVKRAYRPFHVSAAFRTFAWDGETEFRAYVWLHNSGPERSLLNVVATLLDLEGRELYQENLAGEAPEDSAENVGDILWRFPPGFDRAFVLCLEVIDEEGECLTQGSYLHSRAPDPPFAPFLSAPATTLEVVRSPDGVEIRNAGAVMAVGVAVEAAGRVGDSGFPLAPGASRSIAVTGAGEIRVRAWNAPEQRV